MIYKLYGSISNTDSIAQLDIQDDGFIMAIFMSLCPLGLDALNDNVNVELSFMSTNSFASNDTRGSIFQLCVVQNFLTSGGGTGSTTGGISGLAIPISAGERIFLHDQKTTGATGTATCFVYVDDGSNLAKLRPPRRRR